MITRKKNRKFFLFTFSFDSEHCAPYTIKKRWGHFWRGGVCMSLSGKKPTTFFIRFVIRSVRSSYKKETLASLTENPLEMVLRLMLCYGIQPILQVTEEKMLFVMPKMLFHRFERHNLWFWSCIQLINKYLDLWKKLHHAWTTLTFSTHRVAQNFKGNSDSLILLCSKNKALRI